MWRDGHFGSSRRRWKRERGQVVALGKATVGLATADGASEAGGARARQEETDLGYVLSQHTLAVGGGEAR